jgi:hypothetical protein
VSFGGPAADRRGTTSLGYHVDVAEVRAVLTDRPSEPPVAVPDPWPPATRSEFRDLDGDGTPDTLVFTGEQEARTGILIDLDQDSGLVAAEDLENPTDRSRWRFDFARLDRPQPSALYDTDGDGVIDLARINTTGEGTRADLVLELRAGQWIRRGDPGDPPLLDPALVPADRRDRLRAALIALGLIDPS